MTQGPLKVKSSALFLVRLPPTLGKVSWFRSPSASHIHLVPLGRKTFRSLAAHVEDLQDEIFRQ